MTAFASSEVGVASDANTGIQTLDNRDMLHPSRSGVQQYAEVAAAWVPNTFDGSRSAVAFALSCGHHPAVGGQQEDPVE